MLDFAGFPLPLADYAQLLCSADVGLCFTTPRAITPAAAACCWKCCARACRFWFPRAAGWRIRLNLRTSAISTEVALCAGSLALPGEWINRCAQRRAIAIDRLPMAVGSGAGIFDWNFRCGTAMALGRAAIAIVGPREADRRCVPCCDCPALAHACSCR